MSESEVTHPQLPGELGQAGQCLVVMGAPGAGKTTVGGLLAKRLGLPFHDVDAVIEQRAGKTVSEIFADDGEAHFRALERDITIELLAGPGVVSLGGGAVLNPDIRAALMGHEVIWLKVSITQATRRVGMNQMRPLLLGNVRSRLVTLLKERTPLYEAAATTTIDTQGMKARVVVREIMWRLGVVVPGDADGAEQEGDESELTEGE